MAQRELADMQRGLRRALTQKARLAALGIAVTKINHDLRNILATAGLVSDRLATIEDPEVRRVTPKLVAAIDRAVDLCSKTLDYARDEPPPPQRQRFPLRSLIEDVGADPSLADGGGLTLHNKVEEGIEVDADREQLFRVLVNLARNALEAGASQLHVSARVEGGCVSIAVGDNGPGLPEKARENLFQPFISSARAGGTGLGLAIACEIMRAHGGDISLVKTSQKGTVFRLDFPVSRAAVKN
jgi:signal transduction histidine kinase